MHREGATRIRRATAADAPLLADMGARTFTAAFGALYSAADLAEFLGSERTEARYAAILAQPAARATVAEDASSGMAVGYAVLMCGEAVDGRPEPQPARPAKLAQIYVEPAAQGRGVGAALMQRAIDDARAWGADALQLTVFSGNPDAQRFYHRFGFRKVADIFFYVGAHRDDELLFELSLTS